jgi:hypothetical protein
MFRVFPPPTQTTSCARKNAATSGSRVGSNKSSVTTSQRSAANARRNRRIARAGSLEAVGT